MSYPTVTPRGKQPEEFRFLCMIHNIGAVNPEKSLTVEEIAKWTNKEISIIEKYLRRLSELGYVVSLRKDEINRYHVSVIGIRKVLTLYS